MFIGMLYYFFVMLYGAARVLVFLFFFTLPSTQFYCLVLFFKMTTDKVFHIENRRVEGK